MYIVKKMKVLNYFLIAGLSLALVACGGKDSSETAKTSEAGQVAEATTTAGGAFTLDAAASSLEWKATKKVGGHNGTIALKSGSLSVENGEVKAGNFAADMNGIKVLDLTDAKQNGDLTGHLKSPDFFDAAKNPESKFEITKVVSVSGNPEMTHNISGNLTIKGVTKEISIPAKVTVNGKELSATSTFKFNRKDFGMIYHSAEDKTFDMKKMGDMLINDDVELKLNLKAKQ